MKRRDPASVISVGFLTVLGLGLRLAVIVQAGVPLNDGGLFYVMARDLAANHLALPYFTTYNSAGIPYAYPPLAFYVLTAFQLSTRVPLFDMLRFLPAILSALSIPPFFLLAAEIMHSRSQGLLATLVFSLLPRAFEWLIMGGGITRSLGVIFWLLTLRQVWCLFDDPNVKRAIPVALLGSLVVYSHPEATTHTVIGAAVFYLATNRTWKGLAYGIAVGIAVAILTSPWWATVLIRHGTGPFVAAAAAARADSYNALVGAFALFRFDFADEPFISILSVLGLFGIAVQLVRGQFLLPAWFVAMHVLEPRGGTLFMMIPLAMCAAIATESIVLPALRSPAAPAGEHGEAIADEGSWLERLLKPPAVRIALGFLLAYCTMAAYATGWRIGQELSLTKGDLEAFEWVRANSPVDSNFAIISGGQPLRDTVSEWFPALAERRSAATVFGTEWLVSADFASEIEQNRLLQNCAASGASCIEDWIRGYGGRIDYVYVRTASSGVGSQLSQLLLLSGTYPEVYTSPTTVIFEVP
jgi:hypothetical protein